QSASYSHQLTFTRVSSIFLKSLGLPRELHSFPTRRSSDLDHIGHHRAGGGELAGPLAVKDHIPQHIAPHEHGVEHVVHAGQLVRSEEHTSELQSRFDLVCRLLLEKKKY